MVKNADEFKMRPCRRHYVNIGNRLRPTPQPVACFSRNEAFREKSQVCINLIRNLLRILTRFQDSSEALDETTGRGNNSTSPGRMRAPRVLQGSKIWNRKKSWTSYLIKPLGLDEMPFEYPCKIAQYIRLCQNATIPRSIYLADKTKWHIFQGDYDISIRLEKCCFGSDSFECWVDGFSV